MNRASSSAGSTDAVPAYRRSAGDVLEDLGSRPDGLTGTEARERLATHGPNEIAVRRRSELLRFLLQFHNPMIYILLVAAAVTGLLLDEPVDTYVILGVVVLNVIIGYVQEGKAEAAIEALKRMIVAESAVLRDGHRQVIPTRELVPGDVVLLEGGTRVPADLRLLHARNLHADESPLTGESVPVSKHSDPIGREDLGPGDQRNMAFSGTFVTRGTGQGVVIATAARTEFGRIATMMQATPRIVTPLVRKIDEFTRFLIVTILVIAALNFGLGVLFEFPVGYSFLASVALAVAAIPEMLPAIVVAILALASTAMAKRQALIRKLPAAETLGCASVICSDKTGTLTRNEMTVVRLFAGGRRYRVTGSGYEPLGEFQRDGTAVDLALEPAELHETLRAAAWCNDTVLEMHDGRYVVVGDPTEGALVVVAAKGRLPAERAPRLDEIPFESESRYMATLHADPRKGLAGDGSRLLRHRARRRRGGAARARGAARRGRGHGARGAARARQGVQARAEGADASHPGRPARAHLPRAHGHDGPAPRRGDRGRAPLQDRRHPRRDDHRRPRRDRARHRARHRHHRAGRRSADGRGAGGHE